MAGEARARPEASRSDQEGDGPGDDKVHTWPHLVRAEFLCRAVVARGSDSSGRSLVDAPLEEPANPTRTPNPSKAPWYFLGLQEMLVFFDPWHAGVVLPSLIIVGLMVIPYIDINPKGNGYYCFKDRKWEILTFFFGFHILWVVADHHRHVPARPGLELVLALGEVGPAQGRGAHQRRPAVSPGLSRLLVVGGVQPLRIGAYFVVGMLGFYYFVLKVKGKDFIERWGMVRFTIGLAVGLHDVAAG